jgi:hypothetical protein
MIAPASRFRTPRNRAVRNWSRMPAPRRSRRLFLALVAFCGVVGCTRHEYDIDMEPDGAAVKRTTRIKWRSDADADNPQDKSQKNTAFREAVQRLAKAYGEQPPESPGARFAASGRFATRLPDDVGGFGRFVRWESDLGSVVSYAERFRGDDDLYGAFQDTGASVDQIVDLVIGWTETEARGLADWMTVRAFLDGPFRRDLHNLALLSWSLNFLPMEPPKVGVEAREQPQPGAESHMPTEPRKAAASEREIAAGKQADDEAQIAAEIAMRAALYLAERGYFSVEEAPAIARALRSRKSGLAMRIVRTSLASRLRPIAPQFNVEKLAFLQSGESLVESWQRYFVGTDYFRKRRPQVLAAMKRKLQRSNVAHATITDQEVASQMITELLVKAFASFFRHAFEDHDELHLSLRAPHAPLWTNGRWIDAEKTIEWTRVLPLTSAAGEIPAFCFAIWSEPNLETQRRLFGRAALDDRLLIEYCLWHSGLTPSDRKEWDDFVKTLTNDAKSQQKLTAFRFAHEPIIVSTGDLVAAPAIKILKDALPGKP